MKRIMLVPTCLFLMGCLENGTEPGEPDGGTEEKNEPRISVTQEATGYVATVDASDYEQWVYLRLSEGEEVWGDGDAPPATWDLAFRRFHINTNGGIHGDAGAEGMFVNASADQLLKAPSHGYWQDAEDGEDDGNDPDSVFLGNGGWYDYDPQNHILTPKEQTYIVHNGASAYYAVTIEDYYNEAASPANFTIRWREILPPQAEVTFDSDDRESWFYLNFQSGVVSPAMPADSIEWDMAVSRTMLRTNSGTSGSGVGGAKFLAAGTAYNSVTQADGSQFQVDTELVVPGPPPQQTYSGNPALENWYDYDPVTHTVTPKDLVAIVKGANGVAYKFKITAYTNGKMTARYEHIDIN